MSQIATFYDHMTEIAKQEKIPVFEAMQEAKKLGIELLEISQNNVVGREDEIARELAYAGLGISAIPAYFDFGRDRDVDRQSEPVLEAAQFLGAKKLLVIPGFFQEGDSEESRAAQVESIIDCVNRLAEKAAGYGVSLTMEDFDNALSPISTVEGLRRVLDGCPALSCCFDTGNFRFAGQELSYAYDALRDRIGHVHLKDRSYTGGEGLWSLTAADGQTLYPAPVGGGDLDLKGIVEKLRAGGYDGIYTVEHYGAPHMLEFLKSSVQWLSELGL